MSDNPAVNTMANEKRTSKVTVRLEPRLRDLADAGAESRGASDISDYIRGLLLSDAHNLGAPLKGLDLPGWLIGEHLTIEKRPTTALIDEALKTEQEVFRGQAQNAGKRRKKAS